MSRSAVFSLCVLLLAFTLVSAEPKSGAPEVPRKLLEERLSAARSVYEQDLARLQAGQALPGDLIEWSQNWLEAELRLEPKPAERVQSLRNNLDRLRNVERMAQNAARTGQGRQSDALAATYHRLGAEIRLIEAGATGHPPEVKREE
ncbi:MAG TPA: hypothetical protein VHB77_02115 [Planctomycetaceae bacterium]|nr:hypothetical protein [Planctomycetaceae bacterium]